jgi:photosystem II stability/assembly factor-like uncharacterized protein
MDPLEQGGLSRRRRRAVALAAGAAIVLVVVGVAYLRGSAPATTPKPGPVALSEANAAPEYVLFDFISPTVAWALGFARNEQGRFWVSRTMDGGKHWQTRLKGKGTEGGVGPGPVAIRFFDEKRGFVAVGWSDKLLRTTDGGATWKSLSFPDSRRGQLAFKDARQGWMLVLGSSPDPISVVGRLLYATDDAGDSWTKLPDPPAGTYLMEVRRSSELWLAGASSGLPRVYRSLDGGLSWQRHEIPIDKVTISAGPWNTQVMLLKGDGVIVSVFCACNSPERYNFTSFDGGATWRSLPPDPGRGLFFTAYQDDLNWWAIDGTSLYRSSDAGQTWTKASDQIPNWHFLPRAIDKKHAWAQTGVTEGLGFGLATTNDAGVHWTKVTIPQTT